MSRKMGWVGKMTQQETVWICAERIRCATCSRDFRLEEQKEKAGRKGNEIKTVRNKNGLRKYNY